MRGWAIMIGYTINCEIARRKRISMTDALCYLYNSEMVADLYDEGQNGGIWITRLFTSLWNGIGTRKVRGSRQKNCCSSFFV